VSSPILMLHFERTTRLSDQFPMEAVRVHAEVACGQSLKDIAAVIDPTGMGANPCLLLLRPLGFGSVDQIMHEFRDWVVEGDDS
jgi:hypothetical protein